MSFNVTRLVYSRVVGSAVRKSILSYMADRSDGDGRGVWCSKQTIANETEYGRSTVIRTCNDLVAQGLLIVIGERKCGNGSTVEYALNLEAIAALPISKKYIENSLSRTIQDRRPSRNETPLVPERDPTRPAAGPQAVPERDTNHPVTTSEPSLTPPLLSPSAIAKANFQDFWDAYPHRQGKKTKRDEAEKAFVKAIKGGASIEQIAKGVESLRRDPDTQRGYQRGPVPWLNQRGWTDEIPEVIPQHGETDNERSGSDTTRASILPRRGGPHHNLMAGFAAVADQK